MADKNAVNTNTFSIPDYLVFAATLLISSVIGIYFACGGKQKNTKEYLMAGRNMSWFPLFVSLLASYLSAITLLGVPSEIFTYGIQYIILSFSYSIVVLVSSTIFLPIFYNLQMTSSNEYLEKRFTPGIRSLGCVLVMTQYILYLAVVLYAPSLALESVAGIPLTATIISTGVVCTFYTTLGGMKAVIWTDVFQAGIMVAGLVVVMVIGLIEIKGFKNLFTIATKGERMTLFDFNPDPTVRNTFWTLLIGGAFTAMPLWTVCQPAVQRFQAAKSIAESKKALLMNIPGLMFIVLLCALDGLIIYAVYHECNIGVGGIKAVKSNDQVLPYFIIHKMGHLKGVAGLFTSCLFSGALSTASSGLNSMAAVALEDIVKKIKPGISEQASTMASKTIACFLGVVVIGLAFLVSLFGSMVLQLAYSIFGIVGGPYLGLFFLGMMFPFSNSKGAYCGALIGVSSTLWLAIGGFLYPPNKHEAVIHVYGCNVFNSTNATIGFNSTNATMNWQNRSGEIRPIYIAPNINPLLASWYSVSYLWYAAIGVSFTVAAGCLFSLIFNVLSSEEKCAIEPRLLFDYGAFFQSITPSCLRKTKYIVDENTESSENLGSIQMCPSTTKLCEDNFK
ncbi:sodium-coupled monocarboxylate transporter 1 isoform X1 [Hydra vulgaris]|uniref:sodium-coupled monocarboxylate transporter 1 isoform X1 n=1 Tax=Hydra vulgaris TaxID=6087 RepID=UPI001F5FCBC3|nr:sodium-coupled monocarboxylate transporter 1 [Hydra vulgaris]